ncbi:MAG: hypothetical protein E7254_07170 [Lachnospiraceae bacterium]|nr:hypothetical protein [Lachnospiraceae bacterium]
MKLIIGGRASGKTEYANREYDGSKIADNINDLARELFDSKMSYEMASEYIIKNYADFVVITDEVGNGIVPVDKTERDFREWIGRVQVSLAKEADEVVRVICGIGQRIK